MNIKILDSWLREHLKTKASAKQIAELLSLSSVSVERLEKFGNDYLYDIEVTTNRPDLMSVIGLAREATAVLSQNGIKAEFSYRHPGGSVATDRISTIQRDSIASLRSLQNDRKESMLTIKNDPKLVNRICAAILEVEIGDSPKYIKERLEASSIRTLNNLIDVTNYIMREIGHPAHVFDYDRLKNKTLIIRESKKGEKIITLDGKEHILQGGDIVADNGEGQIVDLLGVMGTANSVVTDNTKRILFFIDNNESYHIRRTSMSLSVRTEAAVLNEKWVDPEVAYDALLRGIDIYKQVAEAKLLSEIIDIYPNKPKQKKVNVPLTKINKVIGVDINPKTSHDILKKLGFKVNSNDDILEVTVPTWRSNDIEIPEDLIEEVARIYGYHRIPSILPPISEIESASLQNEFYWENRIKNILKYWGFTEMYTMSMVSEDLYEGPIEDAVTIQNPLTEDMVHMRKTLIPSLLASIRENSNRENIKLFELANMYIRRERNLPNEVLMLAGVVKKPLPKADRPLDENISFYEVKGIIEQLLNNLGIDVLTFKNRRSGGLGADIYIEKNYLGDIEILEDDLIDFELNFETIINHANIKKAYKPIPKYPPIIEDLRVLIDPGSKYEKIVSTIKNQSDLVKDVSLLDVYENKKTFRIIYQDPEKNLTNENVAPIREKIFAALERELRAKVV